MKPLLPLVGVCLSVALHPAGLFMAPSVAADRPAQPASGRAWELARGGGARGGGGSGRRSGGNTGFGSYGGGGTSFRGSQRPSGGWSSNAERGVQRSGSRSVAGSRASSRPDSFQSNRGERTSGRQENRTERSSDRQGNRTERSAGRQENRSDRTSDRTNLRTDRLDNRWDNHWAGWARPGWGYARPWNTGWYGGSGGWGWWANRPVGWGLTALATGAAITSLVNEAIENKVTYIVVPDTSYRLYYSSVEPSGIDGVSFAVNTDTGGIEMSADCRAGTLNGRVPQSAAEAQLLNAVCEVTYGSAT